MPTCFAVDSSTEARAPWRSWLEQEILISCQWCSSVVERVQVVPMFEPVGDWVYLSHQTRRTTGHRQSCDNLIEGQPLPEPIRLAQAQMFKRVFCIFWYQHKFRCYRYSSLYKLHFTTSFPVDRMGDGDGILRVCIIEVNGWTNEYDVPCSQWPTPASLALDKYQDQAWQVTKPSWHHAQVQIITHKRYMYVCHWSHSDKKLLKKNQEFICISLGVLILLCYFFSRFVRMLPSTSTLWSKADSGWRWS